MHAELAQAGAGIVIGDGAVVARGDLGDAEHVDEEAHQLVAFGGEGVGLDRHVGLVGEQFGIVLGEHAGAGAARRDDVVAAANAAIVWRAIALARRRGRRNCRRAGRSRSGAGTITLQPASSSSFTAAKPTLGRNRSTRQVTNRPTRIGGFTASVTGSSFAVPRSGGGVNGPDFTPALVARRAPP